MYTKSEMQGSALTHKHVHATQSGMGRKKQFTEQIRLPLPEGKTAEIDSVLNEGEVRLDMVREVIDREIKSRLRKKKRDNSES